MNQIKHNAETVAELAGADWQTAYVIACSVEHGQKGRPAVNAGVPAFSKVSVREFARMVKAAAGGSVYGLGQDGIASRLRKWDEMADKYGLAPSTALTPENAGLYPTFPDVPFARQDGSAGEDESNKGKVKDIQNNARSVTEAFNDKKFVEKVISGLSKEAKANLISTVMPQIDPLPEPIRNKPIPHDILDDSVPSDMFAHARRDISRIKQANDAGTINWTLMNKGVWEQIVNMVAAVTMTVDLSDVHAMIDAEGK